MGPPCTPVEHQLSSGSSTDYQSISAVPTASAPLAHRGGVARVMKRPAKRKASASTPQSATQRNQAARKQSRQSRLQGRLVTQLLNDIVARWKTGARQVAHRIGDIPYEISVTSSW